MLITTADGETPQQFGDLLAQRVSVPPAANPNVFQAVAELGYKTLIPIIPFDAKISTTSSLYGRVDRLGAKDPRGKAPGVRIHDGTFVSFDWVQHETTPRDFETWHPMGCDVGLRFGDGVVGFDADTMDPALSETVARILREMIPGNHVFRVGQAPKFMVLLRIPSGAQVPFRMIQFNPDANGKYERVELLSTGKQGKIAGIHPGTRKPYAWLPAMPRLQDLVEATPAQLVALFERIEAAMPNAKKVQAAGSGKAASPASLRGDPDAIERAMKLLPNTTALFPEREDYLKVGYAILGAIPDDRQRALAIFDEWSDRWLDPPDGGMGNAPGTAAGFYRSMTEPPKVGANWLYEKLEECTGISVASHWLQPIADTPPSLFDLAPAEEGLEAATERFPAVRTIDGTAIPRALPCRKWAVHPWCPANAVSAIVGAPGVSKSAFGLMVAVAVASGVESVLRGKENFSGERVHCHGPALVYNREDDFAEMQRRVHGLCAHHKLGAFAYPLHAVSGVDGPRLVIAERKERGGRVHRAAGFVWLRDQIRLLRPALVVLDPLISLSAGLEENSNDDMEFLLAELRYLASTEDTTIIVVHHAGKNADKSSGELAASRGASAIAGAIRGGITVTAYRLAETPTDGPLKGLPAGRYVVAEGIKSNYSAKADPVVYKLRPVPVGNGTGDRLPPSGAEHDDPRAILDRNGDEVVVHEIVDRRGAEARAQSAALAKTHDEARAVATTLLEQLGLRTSAPLSSEITGLSRRLIAAKLIRGDSAKAVTDKLKALIYGRHVDLFVEGQTTRISVEKEGSGATAPRIIRRELIEAESFGGLFE